MIMTDLQYASLVISLSTLGQTEIEGLDTEQLRNLDYLLEAAKANVRKALALPEPAGAVDHITGLSDEKDRAFDTSGRDYDP